MYYVKMFSSKVSILQCTNVFINLEYISFHSIETIVF